MPSVAGRTAGGGCPHISKACRVKKAWLELRAHSTSLLVAVTPAATAAAPAAAISAVASTTTATASAAAFGFRPCFVDVDGAPADRGAVQGCDCLLAVFVAGHFHEAETAGTSGVTVGHDAHAVDLPERLKQLPEFVFVGVEAQVAHENILHASASALSCRKCEQFGGLGRSGSRS